jgi:CheY-like chemotaxis protein
VSRRRVLFVDDSPEFLATIRKVMSSLSEGTWDVLVAEGAGTALTLLQHQPVDLIVTDIEMPVVDGVQFLRLLQRKYPATPRTALSSYLTEERRAACLEAGAEICFEKPVTPDGMKQLYAALNELAHPSVEEGFRGVLRRVGLMDVIQMECLAANSSVLEVTSPDLRGEIFIRNGSIIHAWAGDTSGEKGLYRLLSLRGGQFALRPFVEPPQPTIEGTWESLLMEAARQQDEARGGESSEEGAVPGLGEVVPAPAVVSASPRAEAGSPEGQGPSWIEEVLLCSAQGEVLYEWQCPKVEDRISLLEFISQKGWQLQNTLPIGRLDRVELQAPSSRIVMQVQSERGLLVRSSRPPRPSA